MFKSVPWSFNMKNATEVTAFVLRGFTDNPKLQIILFFLFLTIYLFTLMGNLGLIILVIGDSRLHNPMYYFLSALSFVDACYSSVITPQMLVDFLSKTKIISLLACAAQTLLFITFGTTECFLFMYVYVCIYVYMYVCRSYGDWYDTQIWAHLYVILIL